MGVPTDSMDSTRSLKCMAPHALPAARGARGACLRSCKQQSGDTEVAGGASGHVQAMRSQLLQTRQRLHQITASVSQLESQTHVITASGRQQEVVCAHAEVVERVKRSLATEACPGLVVEGTCSQADKLDDESSTAIFECAELLNNAWLDQRLAADFPKPGSVSSRKAGPEVSRDAHMELPLSEQPRHSREAGFTASVPPSPVSVPQALASPSPSRLARSPLPPVPLLPSTSAIPASTKATLGLLGTQVLFKPHEPRGVPALPTGSLIDFASAQVEDVRKTTSARKPLESANC